HFSSSSMYIYDSLIFHFFSLHGVHPDLHSFPTRRSSDLRLESAVICRMIRRRRMLAPAYTMSATAAAISQSRSGLLRYTMSRTRSEEHTSELQSRENLVCRLLLEKKKKKSTKTTKVNQNK